MQLNELLTESHEYSSTSFNEKKKIKPDRFEMTQECVNNGDFQFSGGLPAFQ